MDTPVSGRIYLNSDALETVSACSPAFNTFDYIPIPDQLVEVNARGVNRVGEICAPAPAAAYQNAVEVMVQGNYKGRSLHMPHLNAINAAYSTNPDRVFDLSWQLSCVFRLRIKAKTQVDTTLLLMDDGLEYGEVNKQRILMDMVFHCDNLVRRILSAKRTGDFNLTTFQRQDYHMPMIEDDRLLANIERLTNRIELKVSKSLKEMLHDGTKNGNRVL